MGRAVCTLYKLLHSIAETHSHSQTGTLGLTFHTNLYIAATEVLHAGQCSSRGDSDVSTGCN